MYGYLCIKRYFSLLSWIIPHILPLFSLSLCTEYCGSRAVPNVANSQYLEVVGENLHKNIDILWTGRCFVLSLWLVLVLVLSN